MTAGQAADLLVIPAATNGLPPAPPPALDPYLDAAARCFARFGVTKTTVPDIARDLGVSRATVYRQVGSVDRVVRLLLARELHRLLGLLPAVAEEAHGPDTVIRLVAGITRFAHDQPVLAKALRDEPELIGTYLATTLGDLLARVSAIAVPLLDAAMARGLIARRDPAALADHLVRTTLSLVIAPPPGDLARYLDEVLRPVLTAPARGGEPPHG